MNIVGRIEEDTRMREITGYDYQYYINEEGIVLRRLKTGRMKEVKTYLKKSNAKNYVRVCMIKDGKPKHVRLHRLLMCMFNPVDNMDQLQVDHINGDTTDNRLDNLRWVTDLTNQYNRPKHLQPKALECVNKYTGEKLFFNSKRKACKYFNVTDTVISNAIRGKSVKLSDWHIKIKESTT